MPALSNEVATKYMKAAQLEPLVPYPGNGKLPFLDLWHSSLSVSPVCNAVISLRNEIHRVSSVDDVFIRIVR